MSLPYFLACPMYVNLILQSDLFTCGICFAFIEHRKRIQRKKTFTEYINEIYGKISLVSDNILLTCDDREKNKRKTGDNFIIK